MSSIVDIGNDDMIGEKMQSDSIVNIILSSILEA